MVVGAGCVAFSLAGFEAVKGIRQLSRLLGMSAATSDCDRFRLPIMCAEKRCTVECI
jgi:hypothetical protein